MRMRTLVVVVATLLLAGCGAEAAPTPPDPQLLLKNTRAALEAATSYHVAGSIIGEGGTVLTLDLTVAGHDATGTYGDPEGGEQTFIRVGDEVYIRGNQAFLDQLIADPVVAASLTGKWAKADGDDPRFLNVGTGFGALIPLTDSPRTGESATIGEATAFTLLLADEVTLYVAAEGKPYPLRVAMPGGTIDFDGFDQPVTIAAPPADEVVDLAS